MRVERYRGTTPGTVDEEVRRGIIDHGDGPGIVSADSIADAESYAGWLTERGIPALAIHSGYSREEQDRRIRLLEARGVRCLVHVALLAEGVDLPWLRWIALRRYVQARVRFVQEIGRVLRVATGKREAVIIDPHCLLGRHGMESAEAIGAILDAAAEIETREERAARVEEERSTREVLALDALAEYLSDLTASLREAGIVGEAWTDGRGDLWRVADVTGRQVEKIRAASRLTRHVPEPYRAPLRALITVPWALTSGQASDLLAVLWGGQRWAQGHRERYGLRADRVYLWDARRIGGVVLPTADETRTVRLMRADEEER
jgi:hypothetical protein